jgi:integrase
MANIRKIENKSGISYKITVTHGRDAAGKQKRHYLTWTPAEGMTPKKIEKELAVQALKFEEEIISGMCQDANIKFSDFANKWYNEYALKQLKAKTFTEYQKMFPRIFAAIGHKKLKELKTGHLNTFYANLQEKGINTHTSDKAIAKKGLKQVIKAHCLTIPMLSGKSSLSVNTISVACRGLVISKRSAESISKALNEKFNDLFNLVQSDGYLSPSTVKAYHRLISSILSKAVKWGYIPYNPAINTELPKQNYCEASYLDESDAKRLLDVLQNEPIKYRTMITFDLLSGLRRGELLGLRPTPLPRSRTISSSELNPAV